MDLYELGYFGNKAHASDSDCILWYKCKTGCKYEYSLKKILLAIRQ